MQKLIEDCLGNLIVSPGGSPSFPRCIQTILPHPRIIHSSEYLSSVEPMLATMKAATRSLNIAVVGAGQSAVEVLLNLNSRLTSMGKSADREHNLHLIVRGGSLKPSDGGPFANQVYNPEYVDIMYGLPSESRRKVIAEHKDTNYGAVNPRTLESVSCISSPNSLGLKNATTALRSHVRPESRP